MTDDYHTFTDRIARNYAVLRAEQEEWRREEEQRRGQPLQQPQTSYQLPLTDSQLIRRIDERVDKAVCEAIAPKMRQALANLVDDANRADDVLEKRIIDLEKALARECEKNAGLHSEIAGLRKDNNGLRDEIGGLRADLTIMRTINANRNVFGVVRKETNRDVA